MRVALCVFIADNLKSLQMLVQPLVMFNLFPSLKLQIEKTSKIRAGNYLGDYLFQLLPPLSHVCKWPSSGQDVPDDPQTKTKLGQEPRL